SRPRFAKVREHPEGLVRVGEADVAGAGTTCRHPFCTNSPKVARVLLPATHSARPLEPHAPHHGVAVLDTEAEALFVVFVEGGFEDMGSIGDAPVAEVFRQSAPTGPGDGAVANACRDAEHGPLRPRSLVEKRGAGEERVAFDAALQFLGE